MSDKEKGSDGTSSDQGSAHAPAIFPRRTGIKGAYYNPHTQVAMLGFVCFMCPGMSPRLVSAYFSSLPPLLGLFNALNGLGAGGQLDSAVNSNSNSALYATFAAMAFFAGSINNKLGSRMTLFLGSFGYALYIGSYLTINIHANTTAFVITAGAILGLCAGMLWTAQGSLMMSYPTESEKGRFIGIFWSIFNMGAVIGSAVALGNNWDSPAGRIGNGTYIAFLILTAIGVVLPLLMADPSKMVRTDGTKVPAIRHPSWKTEIYGLWVALRTDPMIVLLFPMFFASNWFYTWQFSGFNGAIFDLRARGLNNFVYWLSQILGSISIGILLDRNTISRRVRAFTGWTILFCLVFAVHIWGFFYQREYTRATYPDETGRIDVYDPAYIGRVMFYITCGLLDAMWQTTAYWLMGAMSNDPAKLAYFAGFYKSIQSAGAAGSWRADAVKVPFMNMFLSTWALLVAGLVFALPMLHLRVKNTTTYEDEIIARMHEMHERPEEKLSSTQ